MCVCCVHNACVVPLTRQVAVGAENATAQVATIRMIEASMEHRKHVLEALQGWCDVLVRKPWLGRSYEHQFAIERILLNVLVARPSGISPCQSEPELAAQLLTM
jgi:hypothetical protein